MEKADLPVITCLPFVNLNCEMKAPPGKFRVVWEDAVDFCDGVIGDFDSYEEAMKVATERPSSHIFNESGQLLHSVGGF